MCDFCKTYVAKTMKKDKEDSKKWNLPSKSKAEAMFKLAIKKAKTEEEREKIKKEYKIGLEQIKKAKRMQKEFYKMRTKKVLMEQCKQIYCNEGCKGTIYEDEPGTEYIKSIKKNYPNDPKSDEMFLNIRKGIFKGKQSVLKDNFFEEVSSQKRNKLIKEGATSGCGNVNIDTNCAIQ